MKTTPIKYLPDYNGVSWKTPREAMLAALVVLNNLLLVKSANGSCEKIEAIKVAKLLRSNTITDLELTDYLTQHAVDLNALGTKE